MSQRSRFAVCFAAGVILLTILDQWTKQLAVRFLLADGPRVLIPGVFELRYLENRGAAFGMMQGGRILFFLLTAIVLLGVIWILVRTPAEKKYAPLAAALFLVFCGGVGNLIDRIRLAYVIDFLYFSLIDFPIFNVADCYVTVGTFLLIFLVMFYYKDHDLDYIFGEKK